MIALIVSWLLATGVVIALNLMMPSPLPGFVAKVGPFVAAGLAAGRFTGASGRARIVAALVLALISAIAWTAFAYAANKIPVERALVLLAASLPVHLLGGAWAYLGMWLTRRSPRVVAHDDRELEDLEREIKDEMK